MKKLFVAALSTFLVLGMAACGKKNNSSSSQKEKTAADFSETVIKDGDTRYGILGPSAVKVGDEFITKAWGEADGTFGVAEATSLRDVANRSISVAEAFEGKDLKGLYKLSKVQLGHEKVVGDKKGGYNEKGEYVEVDGVFGSKFGKYEYDDETEKYAVGNWIPSAEVYTESLTPEMFWAPAHSETKDEHNLDHNSNPIVLGGAGEYTYYLGVYKKAIAGSYYGFAVFQDEKLSDFDPDAVTYDGVDITVTGVPSTYQTGHDLYAYFWGSSQVDSMFLPMTVSGSNATVYLPNDATGFLVLVMAAGDAPSWDNKVAQTSDITPTEGVTSYAWPA